MATQKADTQRGGPGTRGYGGLFHDRYKDRRGLMKEVATWSLRYYADGKQRTESAHTTDRRKAEKLLRERTGAVASGKWEEPESAKTKFEQIADALLNDYKSNKRRSLDRLMYSLAHLRSAFQGQRVKAINSARLTQYKADRQAEGAANGSINRELAALKRAFVLARKAKLVRVGDIPEIEMLQEPAGRKGFFERDQFEAVRRHLPDHLYALVTVGYITGWRIKSELLTRTWAHVDFHGGWLRLEPGETKNDEGRQFPLIPELREALLLQKEYTEACQKEQGRIIPDVFHRQGRPIRHFRRAWRTACKQAGCPGRIPHDFRRTAVRNLERSGVSRSAGMAMVGHRTASIYKRYSIVDESDLMAAGAKLATLGQRNPGETKGEGRESSPRSLQAEGLTS